MDFVVNFLRIEFACKNKRCVHGSAALFIKIFLGKIYQGIKKKHHAVLITIAVAPFCSMKIGMPITNGRFCKTNNPAKHGCGSVWGEAKAKMANKIVFFLNVVKRPHTI